jgi:hypothetical protein
MSPASPGSNGIAKSMEKVKDPQILSALNSKNAYPISFPPIYLIEREGSIDFAFAGLWQSGNAGLSCTIFRQL